MSFKNIFFLHHYQNRRFQRFETTKETQKQKVKTKQQWRDVFSKQIHLLIELTIIKINLIFPNILNVLYKRINQLLKIIVSGRPCNY